MKKAVLIIVAVALICALALSAAALSKTISKEITFRDIKITLNGNAITPKDAGGNPTDPFIMDGSTYLPARAIAEALGMKVEWDGATSTVKLTSGGQGDVYITRTGSKYHYDATCNGGTYWPVPLDTAVGMGLSPCDKCVLTNAHPQG